EQQSGQLVREPPEKEEVQIGRFAKEPQGKEERQKEKPGKEPLQTEEDGLQAGWQKRARVLPG
ncbi:MAG: hypothetical protein Q4B09_03645, partial [Lachnospiraceae bacterium]|nr:hypothetical protein [Lachnospiraceae bacterium]